MINYKQNWAQRKAIEKSYFERLQKLYPEIDYSPMVYLFKREVLYVGLAKNGAERIISHITTKDKSQHLDASLAKWGLNNEKRKGGWTVSVLEKCPVELLDERETHWINHFHELGFELYNVAKTDGGERAQPKGFRRGKSIAEKHLKDELKTIFKYLSVQPKDSGKMAQRMFDKWNKFIGAEGGGE